MAQFTHDGLVISFIPLQGSCAPLLRFGVDVKEEVQSKTQAYLNRSAGKVLCAAGGLMLATFLQNSLGRAPFSSLLLGRHKVQRK